MDYETVIRRINMIYSLTYSYDCIQSSVKDEKEQQNISKPIVRLLIQIINGKQPVTVAKSTFENILTYYIIPDICIRKWSIDIIIVQQGTDIPNLQRDLNSYFTGENDKQSINTNISNLDKALDLYIKTIKHCKKRKCKNVNTKLYIEFIDRLICFYYFMYIYKNFASKENYETSYPFPLYKIKIPSQLLIFTTRNTPNPYPLLQFINDYNNTVSNNHDMYDTYEYTKNQITYCANKNNLINPTSPIGKLANFTISNFDDKTLYYLKKCTPVVFSTIFSVLTNLISKGTELPMPVEIILSEDKNLCDEYKTHLKYLYKRNYIQSKNSNECIFYEYNIFIRNIEQNIIGSEELNTFIANWEKFFSTMEKEKK